MSLCCLIIILLTASCCLGSHFRGGYFTWMPTDQEKQIEVSYRWSWRRSAGNHFCTDTHISSGELLNGEGLLTCTQGCNGTMTSLRYYCTDFSESEDWTTGTRTFLYNITTASPEIAFGFSGCCLINSLLNGGGSSWNMKAIANVVTRMDTRKINSSPITSIFPINRIQYGCTASINLPVSDADHDVVRCRWANKSDECVGTCFPFPGAVLHEESCTISFQGNITAGFYGASIQVEDFPAAGGTVPYSSVPVEFLVDIYSYDQSCYSLPEFIPPTRADLETVYLTAGTVYFDQIIAISKVPNKRIVEIITVSPRGFKKSPLAEYSNMTGAWYVNITWTPSITDEEKMHILCFKVTDEIGLTSQQRCIHCIVSTKIQTDATKEEIRIVISRKQFKLARLFQKDLEVVERRRILLLDVVVSAIPRILQKCQITMLTYAIKERGISTNEKQENWIRIISRLHLGMMPSDFWARRHGISGHDAMGF